MRESWRKRLNLILAGIVLMLAPWGLMAANLAARSMGSPVDSGSHATVTVEIPSGATARQISGILAEQGLIRSATFFRVWVRYRGLDAKLRSGEYVLGPFMSLEEILRKLVRGEVATYTLTVPEGLTVKQVAQLVERKGFGSAEAFLRAARGLKLDLVPENADIMEPLEGYLFPDTYTVTRDTTEEEFVRLMLGRFRQAFAPEFVKRAEELRLSVHEVVTLASIIEKEAVDPEERPLISAVYHNRLRLGMKLDADPTVNYAIGQPGGLVTYKDLEVDSPYNTYKVKGLPPGPIASPGIDSIRAALYPADAKYLYFVARNDGTHAFSRTYSEHLAMKQKYQGK